MSSSSLSSLSLSLSSNLPNEIVDDILLRLPVKSLSRCRCVCNPWCQFINSPDFVKRHFSRGVEKEKLNLMLIRGNRIYSFIDYNDSLSPFTCYNQSVRRIEYPFESSTSGVSIRGSYNGLICLDIIEDISQEELARNYIYLLNASTKEYKEVPRLPNNIFDGETEEDMTVNELGAPFDTFELSCEGFVYGLGYDSKIEDYKLVRISRRSGILDVDNQEVVYCVVKVYTLGLNSWKNIPFLFFYDVGSYDGVFVEGALHWRAISWAGGVKDSKNIIVSFDLENETFVNVSSLEHVIDNELTITIGNLGGNLCVFGERLDDCIEVWVMKDYGVEESWTKLFTINQQSSFGGSSNYLTPIHYFKNGEILLSIQSPISSEHYFFWYLNTFEQYAMVLYDPKSEGVRTLEVPGGSWSTALTYVESLVSLNTGTYFGRQGTKRRHTMVG